MKKIIFGTLLGAAFLVAGSISLFSTENVEAFGGYRYYNECSNNCDAVPWDCMPDDIPVKKEQQIQ